MADRANRRADQTLTLQVLLRAALGPGAEGAEALDQTAEILVKAVRRAARAQSY